MQTSDTARHWRITNDEQGWQIAADKSVAGCHSANGVTGCIVDGKALSFCFIGIKADEAGNPVYAYEAGPWLMRDVLEKLDDGVIAIKRTWINRSDAALRAVLVLEVVAWLTPIFYMIPCVSYHGNSCGDGKEPKGLSCDGSPWVFACDRTGLPSATFSEDGGVSVGLFALPPATPGRMSSCSLERTDEGMTHRILWPAVELPVSYIDKDVYDDAVTGEVHLKPGESFMGEAILCVGRVDQTNFGWTKAYDVAAQRMLRPVKHALDQATVWRYGITYAKQSIYREDSDASRFAIGLLPDGMHQSMQPGMTWAHRPFRRYEIGWCGQNAGLAASLIKDYLRCGDEDSLQKGLKVIDTWAATVRCDNGLFAVLLDDFEDSPSVNRDELTADTLNLGFGAWQVLEAYELALEAGISKPSWLDMGLGLCEFFVKRLDSERAFGKLWRLDGQCLDDSGTIGCFILLPLIKAYDLTGDARYLDCAKTAFGIYADRDLDNMQCWGGALDTCCIDRESCWPLLKIGLDLYLRTQDAYYLQEAKKAGYYLLSWMFHYDVPTPSESDFNRYGYQTQGAMSVSAQHHHLDPWGALIGGDFLRLYGITGDRLWKMRAEATWQNSLHLLSDGNLSVHGAVRPMGAQNEAFLQSAWSFWKDTPSRGFINDWLVAWPTAYRLLTIGRSDIDKRWWTDF